jgi:hypothetical protein
VNRRAALSESTSSVTWTRWTITVGDQIDLSARSYRFSRRSGDIAQRGVSGGTGAAVASDYRGLTMLFTETSLAGACIIDLDFRTESRGFFARVFYQKEFEAHGLKPLIAQSNIAFNHLRGTVRGMCFQVPAVPQPESLL